MTDPPTLLDEVMPSYDAHEVHGAYVDASPEEAYAAVLATTGREIRLLGPLMALRTLPARLAGRRPDEAAEGTVLEGMQKNGFARIAEDPGREIVLGVVGKFWKPVGNTPLHEVTDRESFVSFERPDYAKAAMNFLVRGEANGSRIVTETRIAGTDAAARRKFRCYWLFVRPGSGAIRRSWLAAIRRRLSA